MTSYLNRLGASFNTLTSVSAGKNFCSSTPRRKDLSNKSEPSSLKSTPMSKSLLDAAEFFAREPNRYAIFTPYFWNILGSIFGFTIVTINIAHRGGKVKSGCDSFRPDKNITEIYGKSYKMIRKQSGDR